MNNKNKKVAKLTAAQYWEWRTTISDLSQSKLEMELQQSKVLINRLHITIAQFRVRDMEADFKLKANKYRNCKKEYNTFITGLEKQLGCTVKGKIIDPIDFTIKNETDMLPLEVDG